MEKQPDLTRVGLIVVVITVLSVTLFFHLFSFSQRPAYRIICGTNLKGLGTAITVYANDYDDNPRRSNTHWSFLVHIYILFFHYHKLFRMFT